MLNSDLRTVEIFAIGNELLVGQVQDTNTYWLIRSVTTLGARVNRAAIIRDDYDHIAEELLAALRRGPRLIITTGGLGPTEDDLTLRAIARALNLELREDPEALEMVRQRYAYLASVRPNFSAELNAARRKMALFPVGGKPLRNPEGAAPGMALDAPSAHPDGITTIVALPGVPAEMKAIFNTSLQPILAQTIGSGAYMEHALVLDKGDESRVAELLREVQQHHPLVYVKSRGQRTGDGPPRLMVVFSMGGHDLALIRNELIAAEQEAIAGLQRLGYRVVQIIEA